MEYILVYLQCFCLQCFDAVGWAAGRASGLSKTEWWGADVVICLERGADLHMAQLMPLALTISCVSKIQIGFTFLVPAHPGSPGQRAGKLNGCVWYSLSKLRQKLRITKVIKYKVTTFECLKHINLPIADSTSLQQNSSPYKNTVSRLCSCVTYYCCCYYYISSTTVYNWANWWICRVTKLTQAYNKHYLNLERQQSQQSWAIT